jgi:hypothetical protein
MRRNRVRALPVLVLLGVSAAGHAVAATDTSIRRYPFESATFDVGDENVTLSNGSFQREGSPDDQLYVELRDVDHGDLDGDGREDAVVTLLMNTGGSGQFTWSQVFRSVGSGKVEYVTETPVGDRASGGVHDVLIVNGRMIDERYSGTGGACCPDTIERQVVRLRGGALTTVGPPTTRALVFAAAGDTVALRFLRGTSTATAYMDGGASVTVDARRGQRLTVSTPGVRRNTTAITLEIRRSTGAVLATIKAPGSKTITLPATGRYTVVGRGQTGAPVDVTIR